MKSFKFQNFLSRVEKQSNPVKHQEEANKLVASLNEDNYPIFENDSTVVLLYKGEVESVEIIGDMSEWASNIPMKRIDGTDLFYFTGNYESNARLNYWMLVAGVEFPVVDPFNPYKSMSGFGPLSELAMPGYVRHPAFDEYIHGEKGGFDGLLSFELPVGALTYPHDIYVYLPPGYDEENNTYKAVYFHDAKDYIEFAVTPVVLNFLIQNEEIEPLIAVFVNPPNLHQPKIPNRSTEYGLNDDYVKFFVDEVVPFITSKFRTITEPNSRLVVGDSYGGLISLYIAFKRPEIFKNAYSQSGYHSFQNGRIIKMIENSERRDIRLYIDIGKYERKVGSAFLPASEGDFLIANRQLRDVLKKKQYDFVYREYPEGHTWGNWRRHLIDALIHFYGVHQRGEQK
jgi:enterochelin esterase family protein